MTLLPKSRTFTRHFAPGQLADEVRRDLVGLQSSDGGQCFGVLYFTAGRPTTTCVLAVHPRSDYTRLWIVPGLVTAGVAVFCLTTRYLNNDTDAQHELMLLDVAAAMRELRTRGFEHIVLFGHSGGGSLTSLYQAQATRSHGDRIDRTATGDPVSLSDEEMPSASGQIHVAVHPGEGRFMQTVIDPAVIDEDDPLSSVTSLDMYDPSNGYAPYPEPSAYSSDWLERYRAAQRARCERIDARALELVSARASAIRMSGARRSRVALLVPHLVIYRTLANPAYLDPTIDPSDRALGSSFTRGVDPIVGNYGLPGLGRTLTPRAWLSTWSPAHSHASMVDTVASYDIPTLFVYATGDTEVRPGEFATIVESCVATDVALRHIIGDHNLHPVAKTEGDPRRELDHVMGEWLGGRFPVHP